MVVCVCTVVLSDKRGGGCRVQGTNILLSSLHHLSWGFDFLNVSHWIFCLLY